MNERSRFSSRRGFLKTTAAAMAGVVFCGRERSASAQRAAITAAQMRAAGSTAKITVVPLRAGVSVLMGSGGNILVTSGPDGKLAVDSGFATSQPQIERALLSVSAEPLRHLINTHWHYDHTDGNEWMHKAGARILAQAKTRTRMSSRQVIPAFDAVLPPSPAGALPTVVFEEDEAVRINGSSIHLRRYTPAHTDTDISVFFPEANVLHSGDTWFHGYYPFIDYDSGGSIHGMLTAATENLSLADEKTIVVPGHGEVGNRRDLVEFREMLRSVQDKVAVQKKAGKPLAAVIASKPTSEFDAKWGGGFITPELFVGLVYRGS
ncbi:glyoxylase-like metal-dependent hydrolase (beta-lactamase superfamily II) [Granulicella aggregans]|uniref:Glyoxylase-like metal-dependent hydrolase (Beta-lactamase superfamily II) n=1 Tax=Granulicella aggregans TaxID=474949 RepID=A0A7W8E3G3_9BACT|nr:MBL fold metallo-hydrolase [Granulicella aggregans]MBB5057436.1 glyoxylase-like metal-dependent hydrolase (beta-lactamase superfamily II) [Granulicella aggregans]